MSAFNHVGQCVTDLERSKRFYCELFGFTLEREITPPDESSAQLLSLAPPLGMTAAYLVRDGLVLELLHFAADGQTQPFRTADDERARAHARLAVGRRHRRRVRARSRIRRRSGRGVEHRRRGVRPRSRRPAPRAAPDGVPPAPRRARASTSRRFDPEFHRVGSTRVMYALHSSTSRSRPKLAS